MYKNILIPVVLDDTAKNETAFAAARALADPDARFTLLHVIETIPVYVTEFIPKDIMSTARKTVAAELGTLARLLPECEVAIDEGRAGPRIFKWAEENGVDCIVIPSHRPVFSDIMLGSVAHYVVRHAKCAVHVVR